MQPTVLDRCEEKIYLSTYSNFVDLILNDPTVIYILSVT